VKRIASHETPQPGKEKANALAQNLPVKIEQNEVLAGCGNKAKGSWALDPGRHLLVGDKLLIAN